MILVQATIPVTSQMIADQMCAAVEGGSNYWCDLIDLGEHSHARSAAYASALTYEGHFEFQVHCSEDEEVYKFNLETIKIGLQVMANDYPGHFADMIADKGDADTGDVFLQCCSLGGVVYG